MVTTPTVWKAKTQVNTTDAAVSGSGGFAIQTQQQIVALADGGYVVVWTDYSRTYNAGGTAVIGQRYDALGEKVGGEVKVSQFINGNQFATAAVALTDGGFLVAYGDSISGSFDIYVRRYDASFNLLRTDVIDNTPAQGFNAAITPFADGSYAVTYSVSNSSTDIDIVGRIVSSAGLVGNTFDINNDASKKDLSEVATLSNGNFVTIFNKGGTITDDQLMIGTFTAAGDAVLAPVVAAAQHTAGSISADVAALQGGGFVVVWTQPTGDSDGTYAVQASLYTNSGAPGPRSSFVVNPIPSGDQYSPSVVALADGGFVVTWKDRLLAYMVGQRFDATGEAVGSLLPINAWADGGENSGVTSIDSVLLRDGRIAYAIGDRATGDDDIITSIWDPRTSPINGSNGNDSLTSRRDGATVNGLAGNDKLYGFEGNDHLNGGPGMDQIVGGGGNDIIDGGAGIDSAVFAGNRSAYTITHLSGTQYQVSGPDGTDQVSNVERFVFNDQALSTVTQFEGPHFELAAFGVGGNSGGWTSNDAFPRTLADINGDGMADIVGFGSAGVSVALATGSGRFGSPSLVLAAFGKAAGGWSSQDAYPREMADINGDGKADIVGFGSAGVYVSLATGGGSFAGGSFELAAFGANAGGWSSQDLYTRHLSDVNGDGMADIVGFGSAGVYVALATGGGHFGPGAFKLSAFGSGAGGWTSDNVFPRELADVNGDGMADIIGFGSAGVYVALAAGGGNFAGGFLALTAFGTAAGGWDSQDHLPRYVADINHDGRADIVGFGNSQVIYSLGQPDGSFGTATVDLNAFVPNAGGWSSNDLYHRVMGDVDGDGNADVVGFGSSGVYVSRAQDVLVV
jgi:hypothetical protein